MTRRRWTYLNGVPHEVDGLGRSLETGEVLNPPRHHNRPFGIIEDSMDPIVSQADGRTYDSKSRYRRSLKQAGMVEIGNERIPQRKPKPGDGVRTDLERALANT